MTKEKGPYVTEQGTTLNIQGLEKDEPICQRMNYIFEQGEKRPKENLESNTENTINVEKTPKPDNNVVEHRDNIEIILAKKEPLLIQSINQLYIDGVENQNMKYKDLKNSIYIRHLNLIIMLNKEIVLRL